MPNAPYDIGTALSQLNYYTPSSEPSLIDQPYADLTAQTDLYLAAIKGKLPDADYSSTKTYASTKKENGLNNETAEHNYFDATAGDTYVDRINKNGSDILYVDTTQTGNQAQAMVDDFKNYDAYFKRIA